MDQRYYILTISCPDSVGIVAAVSGFLAGEHAFITESTHYGDPVTDRFFMRTVFRAPGETASAPTFTHAFSRIAGRFDMVWGLHDAGRKARLMILVSKADHCLNDLLYRYRTGDLAVEIPAIVSNHPDLAPPPNGTASPSTTCPYRMRRGASRRRRCCVWSTSSRSTLVVLARYMQILTPACCERLRARCINIHHSFLPGFKGQRPYHQAHARGVKLIGATAHYVTSDLDEGPIIEQAVERVDHAYGPEQLAMVGRDIENVVLARAVRFHIEHRVLLNGAKTVVLR